jgi:hypothetical protein
VLCLWCPCGRVYLSTRLHVMLRVYVVSVSACVCVNVPGTCSALLSTTTANRPSSTSPTPPSQFLTPRRYHHVSHHPSTSLYVLYVVYVCCPPVHHASQLFLCHPQLADIYVSTCMCVLCPVHTAALLCVNTTSPETIDFDTCTLPRRTLAYTCRTICQICLSLSVCVPARAACERTHFVVQCCRVWVLSSC